MKEKGWLLVLTIVVLAPGLDKARAGIVKIRLEAEIAYLPDPGYLLDGKIKIGDKIEGTYTYDSSCWDSEPAENQGIYRHSSSPYGFDLQLNDFTFRSDSENVDFRVSIGNNLYVSDWYLVRSDTILFGSDDGIQVENGLDIGFIDWSLVDRSMTALSDDSLPSTAPSLADWGSNRPLRIYTSARSQVLIGANVSSVERVHVPEPATILILCSGAFLVCRRYRRL